jgi:enoyl-CoA hydratase/carnithine racemase
MEELLITNQNHVRILTLNRPEEKMLYPILLNSPLLRLY